MFLVVIFSIMLFQQGGSVYWQEEWGINQGTHRKEKGNRGLICTARIHLGQICELLRKTGEQVLHTIELGLELHHVPDGQLPGVPGKVAFSLQGGEADGAVLRPPNAAEGLTQLP